MIFKIALGIEKNVLRHTTQKIVLRIQKKNLSFESSMINSLTSLFQTIHNYTEIKWCFLIPISTFFLRTLMTFPISLYQRKIIQKQNELRPIISGTSPILKFNLAKRFEEAKLYKEKNNKDCIKSKKTLPLSHLAELGTESLFFIVKKEVKKRQKILFKKHNVQLWKNIILPTVQIPLWITISLVMRQLTDWKSWIRIENIPLDKSLSQGGLWWFTDLTRYDEYHIIPFFIGIFYFINAQYAAKSHRIQENEKNKNFQSAIKNLFELLSRVSTIFLITISSYAPVALSLYWISSQFYSFLQNFFFDKYLPIEFIPKNNVKKYNKLFFKNTLPVTGK